MPFDKNQPYGDINGYATKARYIQNGIYYDAQGNALGTSVTGSLPANDPKLAAHLAEHDKLGVVTSIQDPVTGGIGNISVGSRDALNDLGVYKSGAKVASAVMASPPTRTSGTQNANSTILTDADVYTPYILPTDARIAAVSGLVVAASAGNYNADYITETNGKASSGWGIAFYTDAEAFEILFRELSCKYNVRIDGQWTAAADYTVATSAGFHYDKFDFGAGNAAPRLVEIFFTAGAQIRGISIGKSAGTTKANCPYKVWAPVQVGRRLVVFGDSYTYGVGGTNCRDGFAYALAAELGCSNVIAAGVGGQGYIAGGNNSGLPASSRISDLSRYGRIDELVFALGINDYNQSASAVQAAAQSLFQAARALAPSAKIRVLGPWTASGKITPAPIFTAIQAAVTACADPQIRYIETSGWLDTSGGNVTIYNSGDNVHPNTAGHAYIGSRAGRAILTA